MGPKYTDTKDKLFHDRYLHLFTLTAMKTTKKGLEVERACKQFVVSHEYSSKS